MIGRTISHYRITRQLGAGGMGVVYEAVDLKLDRTVALKFLPPESTRDPEAKARFVHEAKAASALDHPNVCTIHEIGETEDGQLFLAMACYEGQTLKDRIDQGPLPLEEALDITRQVAEGLKQAHARDIVHRDIKPANIYLTADGLVKILDFGLAKLAGQTLLTQAGTTLGTASYMAPEVARGEESDRRSDLWGLAAILYEMVTGRLPFPGDYGQAVIYAILNNTPEPVRELRPEVPPELDQIIGKGLAKNLQDRYQDAADLLGDLGHPERSGPDGTTVSVPVLRNPVGFRRRWPWILGVGLLGVVVCLMALRLLRMDRGPAPAADDFALAVVDFRALAAPDDVHASAGMTELVNIGLIENCPVRVMSPEYLRDVRRRLFGSGRGLIEDDQVMAVAKEAGATLVLAGRMGGAGEDRFATWRLVDTRTGESVEAGKVAGAKLTDLVDRIVAGVLPVVAGVCGLEPTLTRPTAVDRLTTDSQVAYTHFVAGMLFSEGNQALQARDELEQAIALDPTFALAYLELGRLHWGGLVGLRDADRAAAMLQQADALKDRLGQKDRLRLEATLFEQQRQIAKAITAYQMILDRTPDDRQTLSDLLQLRYRFWDMQGAAAVADQALAFYPEDIGVFGSYQVQLQIVLGRAEEARLSALDYAQRQPQSANAWDDVSLACLAVGLPDSAEAAHLKVAALDPAFGSGGRRPMCAYVAGDLDRAIGLTEDFLARDGLTSAARHWRMTVSWIELGLAALHFEAGRYERSIEIIDEARQYSRVNKSGWAHAKCVMLLKVGRAAEARDIAEAMPARYDDARAPLYSLRVRAQAAVALGELDAARQAVADLYASQERYGQQPKAFALLVEAEIALAEANPVASLEALDKLRDHGLPYGGFFHIDYLVARAATHRMAGRLDQAVAVHRDLLRIYGGHALSYFELGRLFEAGNRPEEAGQAYGKFLDMWSGADPDRPELAAARSGLAAGR